MEQTSISNLQTKTSVSDSDYLVIDDLTSTYKILVNTILASAKEELLSSLYPIGSIYMSVSSISPSEIFGGTWELIEDTFLLGSGTRNVGDSGGETEHTLTVDEMPSHTHDTTWRQGNFRGGGGDTWYVDPVAWQGVCSGNYCVQAKGGSQAHNNMPPYLVVNIWKRTA